jgi:hypothetical protein
MAYFWKDNDFDLIGQAHGAIVTTANSNDNGKDGFWVVSGSPKYDTTTTKVGDTAVSLECSSTLGADDIVEMGGPEVEDWDEMATRCWLYFHSGGPAAGIFQQTFRDELSEVSATVQINQVARVLEVRNEDNGTIFSGTYAVPDNTWVRLDTWISQIYGSFGDVLKARLVSESNVVLDEVIMEGQGVGWWPRSPDSVRFALNNNSSTSLKVTIDDLYVGWRFMQTYEAPSVTIQESSTMTATGDSSSLLQARKNVVLPKTWKNGVDHLNAWNLNAEVRDRFKAWQGQAWRDWTPEWRFLKMAAEDIPLNVETGNIGTGTISGKFLELGLLRMFRIRWDVGTGMTYDTSDDPGFWAFTLPDGGAMVPGSLSGEGQLDPGPSWIQPGQLERFQLSEASLYTQGIKTTGVVPICWISAQPYPLQWNTGTVGAKARTNGAVLELGGTYLVDTTQEAS